MRLPDTESNQVLTGRRNARRRPQYRLSNDPSVPFMDDEPNDSETDAPEWTDYLPDGPAERLERAADRRIRTWRDDRRECVHVLTRPPLPPTGRRFTACHEVCVLGPEASGRDDLDDPATAFREFYDLRHVTDVPGVFDAIDPQTAVDLEDLDVCTECLRAARDDYPADGDLYLYDGTDTSPGSRLSDPHLLVQCSDEAQNHQWGEVPCDRVERVPEVLVVGDDGDVGRTVETTTPRDDVDGEMCSECLAGYRVRIWSDSDDVTGIKVTTDREPIPGRVADAEYLHEYVARSVELVADERLQLELTNANGRTTRIPLSVVEDVETTGRRPVTR